MEIEELIKWVDDINLHLAQGDHCANSVRNYVEGKGYELECEKYKLAVASHFLKMDEKNKMLYIKRLLRNTDELVFFLQNIAYEQENWWECEVKDKRKDWTEDLVPFVYGCPFDDYEDIGAVLLADLLQFFTEVIILCSECSLDFCDLVPSVHKDIWQDVNTFLVGSQNLGTDKQAKYKTMMRSHRVAAVKMLLTSTSLTRDIDNTKIAAFVEAVTGGNIEVSAKDTVSYKEPTKPAKEAAKEWLKSIGVEVKE